jgi:hypothetical protein
MKKTVALFILFVFTFCASYPNSKITTKQVKWELFLAAYDLVWDSIRSDYYAGAIMGNGLLGSNFYKMDKNSYRFDVGRVDITENRGLLKSGYTRSSHLYEEARLPIGYFSLKPVGKIKSDTMRLSLYNAMTKGVIITDKGKIDFQTYVHSENNYIIFESVSYGAEPDFEWSWTPLEAVSPRFIVKGSSELENSDYLKYPNPPVKTVNDGEYRLSVQPLYCGLTYVVAWKEIKTASKRRIAIAISQENAADKAIAAAKETIDKCLSENKAALEKAHKSWWHNYYTESFASFGDKNMESFYWRQVYKLACATRPDKMVIDLQGPWAVQVTPWPAIWFNLNTQLTYSWQYTANRSAMTRPLWKTLHDNIDNLRKNVILPGVSDAIGIGRSGSYNLYSVLNPANASKNQYEVGNMTWLLFYYWQYCTYNNYTEELTKEFFPLLKSAINYYFHIRTIGNDGKYHLPPTASPEYTLENPGEDVNYDLALLRWGLNTLLDIDKKFKLNDSKVTEWLDFLNNLTDYPTDEHGFRISATLGFDRTHRHYSHLLMIYPLYMVNWEQPESREIIIRSVNRWMSLHGALQGYSFTGSAAMYASMGDGDKAVRQLKTLLEHYIRFNTLYRESGPVFETPMAAAASLQDLYLQSWGGKIRVFPAVPESWQQAEFINFRTEGAFLISAKREKGKTIFIQVESEAGGLCRLQTGMDVSKLKVKSLNNKEISFSIIDNNKGLIEINTGKGDVINVCLI